MKPPIVLYTLEEDGSLLVGGQELLDAYGLTEEQFKAACGERFQKRVIELKGKFQQADEIAVQRAVAAAGDESVRHGARVEQYVTAWSLTDEEGKAVAATAEGFVQLPPNVAAEVSNRLFARIYPGLAASKDFFTLLSSVTPANASLPAEKTPS